MATVTELPQKTGPADMIVNVAFDVFDYAAFGPEDVDDIGPDCFSFVGANGLCLFYATPRLAATFGGVLVLAAVRAGYEAHRFIPQEPDPDLEDDFMDILRGHYGADVIDGAVGMELYVFDFEETE